MGMRQGISQIDLQLIDAVVITRFDRLLGQPRQSYRHLYRGARLETARKRHPLVDHCQDTTGLGIHRDHRSVVWTESLHCRAANLKVLAVNEIASCRIGISRFCPGTTTDYWCVRCGTDRCTNWGWPFGRNSLSSRPGRRGGTQTGADNKEKKSRNNPVT